MDNYIIKYDCGCGTFHSFIFNKKENKLFLFGSNNHNQLGLNHNINKLNSITNDIIQNFNLKFSKIKKFSIGGWHNLILFENNDLYSFGDNTHGQCGFENKNKCDPNIVIPKKIEFFENKKISNIYCSLTASIVLLDDELYVMGNIEDSLVKNNENIVNNDICFCTLKKIQLKFGEKIINVFASPISALT